MSFLGVLSILAFVCIAFAAAWYFEDTLVGIFPFLACIIGLFLYILAFFHAMSWIDWVLILGGIAAICAILKMRKSKGSKAFLAELRRQFCDSHFLMCIIILLIMCVLLRGEQILEWDGYNFWGPDTKSLYYRDGFAMQYSNTASRFGDYTPFTQLILWIGPHLAGAYQEQYLFFAYYVFGALLLFSVADKFRMEKGAGKHICAVFSCIGAIVLPGVVCTAWFRAIYVDSIMAMMFGAVLCQIVCKNGENPLLRKAKILIYIMCLTLVKSIGILWSVLAILFFCLWKEKGKKEFFFPLACAAGMLSCYASWLVFCRVMDRSTYLVDGFSTVAAQRMLEIKNGVFFSIGNNWGYLTSYARAFLLTPMHREKTVAIDLSPALFFVLLFAAMTLLWKFGFIPRKKFGRLIGFMVFTIGIIYTVLIVGQMTMFYTETQYLNPISAVTLMTRYCAPANMGFLILLCAFASGKAAENGKQIAAPQRKRVVSLILTGAFVFSCGAYAEMKRRFIYDPLDETRIEKRETMCQNYADFLNDIKAVPINEQGSRVLLCIYQQEMNPIVTNEASPVSFLSLALTGNNETDLKAISDALAIGHEKYLYIANCEPHFAELLSDFTADGSEFEKNALYEIDWDSKLTLRPV